MEGVEKSSKNNFCPSFLPPQFVTYCYSYIYEFILLQVQQVKQTLRYYLCG